MILDSLILGGIEDQVGIFLIARYKSHLLPVLGAPFGTNFLPPLRTNEPLFALFYNNFIQFFNNSVLFINLFSILSILLALISSFLFFRYLKLSGFLSFVMSLLFSFSPYTWLHIGIHPQLSQIWLIPLFLMSFLRIKSWKDAVLSGLVLGMAVLISNYLGFFLILLMCCLSLFRTISLSRIGLIFLSFALIVIPFLYPYLSSSYFNKGSGRITDTVSTSTARSIEDFQNFSARPWYFFLPPLGNPVLGRYITKPVLAWMKNDWGYFLADDYFPKEHGGDYLGWANLIIFVAAALCAANWFFIKSKVRNHKSEASYNLQRIFISTAFILFLFTLPPFFTLGGHTFYTPGILLYKFFPMFRVTARIGILILLLILSINGLFLQRLVDKSRSLNLKVLICGLLLFSLFEFYIPVSRFNAANVPSVYVYLSKPDRNVSFDFIGPNGKKGHYTGPKIIAEYPSGRSEDVFWMIVHNKGLINPRMYSSPEYGFDADNFTKELATPQGLEEAKSLEVSYLIFHRRRIEDGGAAEVFFRNNLKLEKNFGDDLLFKF